MVRLEYGEDAEQYLELDVPTAADGQPLPAVVLVHGGFWRMEYDLDLMRPLAKALLADGWAVANLEYRRLGQPGGGWPGSFADVAAAVDLLAEVRVVDPARVVTIGHSAGGHLALWLAARHKLPAAAVGHGPRIRPAAVVSLAGVADLVEAARTHIGGDAARELMGHWPAESPGTYAVASPAALLPYGAPQLLVHGDADDRVPVQQSRTHAARAAAGGDPVELVELPGVDHFALIDPASTAWAAVSARLPRLAGRPAR